MRLHEIELGCQDPKKSREFYKAALGLVLKVDQPGLQVFDSGMKGLDFNTSIHHPSKNTMISFITENLEEVMERLRSLNIAYDGPGESHLGMRSISFKDPDDNLIRVNAPTKNSPDWLKA